MQRTYRHEIRGNALVMLGAVEIWTRAFRQACDVVIAIGDARPLAAAFYVVASLGSVFIGREVWRAR